MILGPILAWLFLPLMVLILFVVERNQLMRPGLFSSRLVVELKESGRKGRLGSLIRQAYLRLFGDPSPYPRRKLSAMEQNYAALRIHRIYNRLMKLSSEVGQDFHPHLSPEENLQVMKLLFPALKEDLANITGAHARLMFKDLPERQHELDLVERSWLRVQAFRISRWKTPPVLGWSHDQPGCTCS